MTTRRNHFFLISSLLQFALLAFLARRALRHRQPLSEIIFSRWAQRKQTSSLRSLVLGVNRVIGSSGTINMLALPAAAFLWWKHLRVEAVITVALCWIGELIKKALKKIIDRPRPNPLLVHVAGHRKGKSFPSGDVSSTVMFWGWLAYVGLWKSRDLRASRMALFSFPAFSIAFVGPARIYLGDHWLTDVLGGYLFGGGWLCLTLYLYRLWGARGRNS
ncbi:MAG TPA: phosphatase PAP2 family protein [Ktedonobacteraceae bacterium]|nr:phosphatase PAP2 family protein [Ktedonobacteraceae bacterium]